MTSAIVNSAYSPSINLRATKFFKVAKNYFCRIRGHLEFNPKILAGSSEKNGFVQAKMAEEKESFSLSLSSLDPNCPVNIRASLKYEINRKGFSTLLFCLYVIILAALIIRGGYKLVLKFNENILAANQYSIFSLQMVATIDFGLMMNFLYHGRLD